MKSIPRRLFVILIGFLNWNVVIGDQVSNSLINLTKRLDYRSCTERFDVHRDTIIQTEDSRRMGASFLYHVEAANRDVCLRACCETDQCDVFVFEEKYQGSCFLFQCGPPDDFRCQFAAHANYSIAVLSVQDVQRYKDNKSSAPSADVAVPPQGPHLSKHEQELVSLKTGRESFGSYRMPEMGSKAVNHQTTAAPFKTTTSTTAIPSCGRFQFKCHSGECIAIYNACDGIPQCEDGSDETPACPSQPTSNNKKHSNQLEEAPLYRINPQSPSQLHLQPHRIANEEQVNLFPERSRPQYPSEGMSGNYNGAKYSQDMISGVIEKPPLRNREDPPRYYQPSSVDQPQMNAGGQLRNPPQQIIEKEMPQKTLMQSQDTMNMIYNINEPANRPLYDPHMNQMQSPNVRPVDYYSSPGQGGGGGTYRDKYYLPSNQQPLHPVIVQSPQLAAPQQWQSLNYPPSNNNWPTSINNNLAPNRLQGDSSSSQPLLPQLPNNNSPQGNWPSASNSQSGIIADSNPPAAPVGAIPSNPQSTKIEVKQKVHRKGKDEEEESDEEAAGGQSQESDSSETTTAPKKGKSRGKHRKLEKDPKGDKTENREEQGMPTFPPIYQQLKAIGSELDTEIIDHDGHSDRPGGAIVSLLIGVSLTAILSIFIACRMRTVGGRRVRRVGKGGGAHDADFLVNGMYL